MCSCWLTIEEELASGARAERGEREGELASGMEEEEEQARRQVGWRRRWTHAYARGRADSRELLAQARLHKMHLPHV